MGLTELALLSGATGAAVGAVTSIPSRRVMLRQPSRLVRPPAMAAVTGAMFAALAVRDLQPTGLLAGGLLAAVGVPLAAIDLAERRLPTLLVAPLYLLLLTTAAIDAALTNDAIPLARALGGMAALFLFFLVVALASGQLGAGDVRLAGALGLALAWQSWPTLVLGWLLGLAYGAVAGLVVSLQRERTRRSPVPFGPALIAGALTASLIQPASL